MAIAVVAKDAGKWRSLMNGALKNPLMLEVQPKFSHTAVVPVVVDCSGLFVKINFANIQNLCPTQCQYAEEYEIIHKVPSNNHICIKFENYGLIKRKNDVYLWRRGECKNETMAFTINCGFSFSRTNLEKIQKDPSLYLARLLARY